MKKILYSILSLGFVGFVSAQVTTDTITTGAGYLNQKYYSLSNNEQATAGAKDWHVAFCALGQQPGMSIRFNSLNGVLRLLPNADVEAPITSIDTSGWANEAQLVDMDSNYFVGAFDQNAGNSQVDYSWGEYNQSTHKLSPKRIFGAQMGGDFYAIHFGLSAQTKTYHITYYKLGETDSVTYDLNYTPYMSKNYVYTNLFDQSILDLEPKANTWDLFFGQYYTNVGGGMLYPVAGVLNNLKTEVAKVIDTDPANYTRTGTEEYSINNNVIGYTWKAAGQGGVTIADTVVYFVKATDGAIWKVRFTDFISGGGSDPLAGSYILKKELISAVGVKDVATVFTQIYPNPANNTAQLVVDAIENTTIAIYSLTGAQVYTNTIHGGLQTLSINTAELMSGMYQVMVTSNGNTTSKKLIVQH